MYQETDIVYANHHRHGATKRSGVLYMNKVGTILTELHGELDS
jgi:hypothetical protein